MRLHRDSINARPSAIWQGALRYLNVKKEKQRGTAAGADLAVLKSKAKNEMDRKPGSVLIDDLSTPAIADRF